MEISSSSIDMLIVAWVVILIAVFVITGLLAKRSEAKSYNNGHCPKCGNKWRHFDNDSQGGRGYTCDNCSDQGCWVSYSIDRDFSEK